MSDFKGKIAVHAITWGENHLQAMKDISELGYRAIEPWASFVYRYEDNIEAYHELLDQHNLVLTGLYGGASYGTDKRFGNVSVRQELIADNVRLAKLIAKCNADILVLGPGGTGELPSTTEELKIMADTINETAKATYQLGIKSALHPHLWTEIQYEKDIDALMELFVPEVFFAPDTAQLLGAGMDPAAVIRRYQDRVAYLHLKDLTIQTQITKGTDAESNQQPFFCELGLGSVDFDSVFKALNDIHYEGWVTVEVDQSRHTPRQSLEICRQYLEEKLQTRAPARIPEEG
jgi:inosose dehydratase